MENFPFSLPLILDGGTGTHLIEAGMPAGVSAEQWVLDNPDVITRLQRAYVAAGSNAVIAPTFGANRVKLDEYGLGDKVDEINRRLVEISRSAVGDNILVGGDMSPTGLFIEPYGDATFDEIIGIYREQAAALASAGVDFIECETMMSLWECRAALIAARETGLPVFVTITVDSSCRTLMGTSLPVCVVTLQELGAAAIGINCSEGPEGLVEAISRAAVCAKVPLIAKPNAGLPVPGHPGRFDLTVEQFAIHMQKLAAAGASILGGCCGTGPEHIAAICGLQPFRREPEDAQICANESCVFFLHDDSSAFSPSDLIECRYDLEDDLIDLEDERVNVAVVHIEHEGDPQLLSEAAHSARLPIAIHCDNEQLLDRALLLFHGRALVDSACELSRDTVDNIAARYGALVY